MSVLFVLVPVALALVAVALAAFRWAAGRGQFDDLVTPALRVLNEEDPTRVPRDGTAAPASSSAPDGRPAGS